MTPTPSPGTAQGTETIRVAAVADLHFGRHPAGALTPLFDALAKHADVLAICGDLTDHGYPEQAQALARDLALVGMPIVCVLGNHDFEAERADEVQAVLQDAGITVLDGNATEIRHVGFAGTKGFCGGFGSHALGSWGEPAVKRFVNEAVQEALKLETALARVRAESRIALLHYSPVASTVEGEAPEIFPFLGSSRLEEPLSRYPAVAVFHGHAHHGRPQGATAAGVPVFNVSYPLLQRVRPERPFHVIAVPAAPPAAGGHDASGPSVP